jgi:FkbM family methyltransferase
MSINKRIGDVLTSSALHTLLVKHAVKDGFIKTSTGYISVEQQASYLQSLIYWNLYERSEVKLIAKFLGRQLPVIEFGASLGKTTSTICTTVGNSIPVISVEANPKLMANLQRTKAKNNFTNLTLKSAAIDYSGAKEIQFTLDESNLGSRKGSSGTSVSVPTICLHDVMSAGNFERYSLVCDIEGAELEMFLLEKNQQVINGCQQIIIELHPASHEGRFYTPADINKIIIENFSMKLIHNDGKTWVYSK